MSRGTDNYPYYLLAERRFRFDELRLRREEDRDPSLEVLPLLTAFASTGMPVVLGISPLAAMAAFSLSMFRLVK